MILGIGSSCVCRPLYQVPADSSETPSASATPGTPSTTSTTSNPGRIQKPSRKQSNLQAAPNNIAKALKTEPQQAENDFNVTSVPKHVRSPEKSLTPEQNHQPHIDVSTSVPKPGGCCSGNQAPAAPAPAPSRSCCSSKESEKPKEKTMDSAYASWAAPSHMEPLLWNTSLQNGHYSSEAPNYTGLAQPSSSYVSQPNSNSPVVSQPHYMPNMQVGGGFDAISMNQLSFNPAGYPLNISSSTCGLDNNHDCSCGETCQCLGCASHPYNETTTQHVQKMGFLMSIDEETEQLKQSTFFGPESSPLNMSPNGTTQTTSFADNTMLPSNFDRNLSPSNTFATDQFMQPSEYYTLEYSVGLSLCSNISGTCQCGNDCTCVGCLTHDGHNGVALQQPSPNEQHRQQQQQIQQEQTTRETTPQRWPEYAGYNNNIPRTLDQYSPSALSPQIVEAPFV